MKSAGFFLHAEHALSDTLKGAEGKMMAFYTFLSSCALAFPEQTFYFEAGKARKRFPAEKWIDSHGGKQSRDVLSA